MRESRDVSTSKLQAHNSKLFGAYSINVKEFELDFLLWLHLLANWNIFTKVPISTCSRQQLRQSNALLFNTVSWFRLISIGSLARKFNDVGESRLACIDELSNEVNGEHTQNVTMTSGKQVNSFIFYVNLSFLF